MEEKIFEILSKTIYFMDHDRHSSAKEIVNHIKDFIEWKDDLKCPFSTHYNGENPEMPRISYDKGSKNYSIEEVYKFYLNR